MAWSDPGDFTSGQILTAAQMDSVREAMFFGQATFTNEAARDAAIPATAISLQEGMRAYLTASTVTTSAGGTTGTPTGITTIYNGTSWVCITPITARETTTGTRSTTSYGALSGGTNPSVTLSTGTTALVTGTVTWTNSSSGVGQFASVVVSGATTLAASDNNSILTDQTDANYVNTASMTIIVTGLTAGTNTFTLEYKPTGGTLSVLRRSITAQGIA